METSGLNLNWILNPFELQLKYFVRPNLLSTFSLLIGTRLNYINFSLQHFKFNFYYLQNTETATFKVHFNSPCSWTLATGCLKWQNIITMLSVRPKTLRRKKRKTLAIAKLFTLHANAKTKNPSCVLTNYFVLARLCI